MANTIAGMFADPNSFRDERINDLMKQRQAISNMGGSMSDLLGQVAAGGGATGAMMAEGLGGMFGLQTREEAKAAQIQDMASNLNLETPQGLALFARMLNNQGMTEEAMKVFELAKAKEAADLDRKVKEKTLNKSDWEWKALGKDYNAETGTFETTYGWVNPETQKIKRVGFNPNPPTEETGDVNIGTTAKSLQESWGG